MRAFLAVALMVLAFAGCKREEREPRPEPVAERDIPAIVMSDLAPGEKPPSSPDYPHYTENAWQVSEGKRLFEAMNCNGCHARGGGDIGPPLMDRQWIYGSEPGNIFATIMEGRPNGMPSFRNMIPEQQVWQLVAYVRSLAGLVRKDVASGRSDDMSARPSEQSLPEEPPRNAGIPPSATGTQP
ncbi:c-type cytochrome [Benzoatithermus flavus]|uniref:Cytochrome c n=1 Tax=Benzoatithermus flavus TaxID=3108223 RepID=A0ABU8XXU4_9PROT